MGKKLHGKIELKTTSMYDMKKVYVYSENTSYNIIRLLKNGFFREISHVGAIICIIVSCVYVADWKDKKNYSGQLELKICIIGMFAGCILIV